MLGVHLLFVCLYLLNLSSLTTSLAIQHVALPSDAQSQGLSDSIVRKASPPAPSAVAADRAIFRIPRSDIILVLHPRKEVSQQSLSAVLLTVDSWVSRKISIFGRDGPADAIFQYGTGNRPYMRLIVWSSPQKDLTRGQIKTLVDGLWTYLIDMGNSEDTYWEIYEGKVDKPSQIGRGAILETEQPPSMDKLDHVNSNSASKRALDVSSPLAPFTSNISDTMST